MTRKTTEQNLNALKTAFKLVIADVGGLDAGSTCTRVGKSQLSDYGSVSCDKMPPTDVVMDLEAIGGNAHVTAEACRQQGGAFLRYELRPHHELIASLQRIALDNGSLFAEAVQMLNAKASAQARQRMIEQLLDIQQAVHEALLAIDGEAA